MRTRARRASSRICDPWHAGCSFSLERRFPMANSESSSSTGIVAIVAILLMLAIAGFLAWRGGLFGGGSDTKQLDINVNTK
jgi:hypothetical protein